MAPYMVRGGHYMAEGDHPWRRRWSGRTIHGAVYGPGGTLYGGRGPSMALRMVRPDHPRRRTWSGRTIHGAVHGPAGPSTAPWMVPRTMYGAVDGPAGPTVGGTIYGMTVPSIRFQIILGFCVKEIRICYYLVTLNFDEDTVEPV